MIQRAIQWAQCIELMSSVQHHIIHKNYQTFKISVSGIALALTVKIFLMYMVFDWISMESPYFICQTFSKISVEHWKVFWEFTDHWMILERTVLS